MIMVGQSTAITDLIMMLAVSANSWASLCLSVDERCLHTANISVDY